MSQTGKAVEFIQTEIDDLPSYRPVSVVAVVGFLFGLASGVAMFHPVAWIVPLVAIGINVYALRTMDHSSPTIGRTAAMWGLALSVFFMFCAPARVYSYEYLERQDARRLGGQWFDLLRQGKPELAYQMTLMPGERTLDENRMAIIYSSSKTHRDGLKGYVETPLVRTLLALGDKAQVRYFSTETAATDGRDDAVEDIYAVTYDDLGKKKTFFVKLGVWRNLPKDDTVSGWRIRHAEGGYRPKDWAASS